MLIRKKERKKEKRKKQKQIYMGLFLYCFGLVLYVCPHPSPPISDMVKRLSEPAVLDSVF